MALNYSYSASFTKSLILYPQNKVFSRSSLKYTTAIIATLLFILPRTTHAQTINVSGDGSVVLSSGSVINNGLYNSTVGADNSSSTFSGTFNNQGNSWDTQSGSLTKTGTGTLTLDGATIAGGSAYITGGAITQASGNSSIDYLAVGEHTAEDGTPNSGILNVTGGTLQFNVALQIGDFGGNGTVNQSGGAVIITNGCGISAHCASMNIGNQGGTGIYNISGGTLSLENGFFDLGRNTSGNAQSNGTLNIQGTGAVSVDNGSFSIGDWVSSGSSPAGTGLVNQTGGTFTVENNAKLYLSGFGNGTYDLTGGTLQIGGSSLIAQYPGAVGHGGNYQFNLGGGTIQVIGSDLTTNVNAKLLSNSTSIIDTNGFNATWSGVLSGSGSLSKIGAGTLTLSGANTYSGGTVLNDGTLDVQNNTGAGSGAVILANGTTLQIASNTATLETIIVTQSASYLIDGNEEQFSRPGTYAFENDQINFINGSTVNPLTGSTVLSGNISADDLPNTNGSSDSVQIVGSANLNYANNQQVNNPIELSDGSSLTASVSAGDNATQAGALSGGGSLVQNGSGTLTLTGQNTYSGGTALNAGTLAVGNSSALGSGVLSMAQGTTLAFTGGNYAIGNNIVISGDPNFVPAAGTTQIISGVISDGSTPGVVDMTGPGTLILDGQNTYSGGTIIENGMLEVGDANSPSASIEGAVDVQTNGTLRGHGTIGGNVTNNGVVFPGGSIGALRINGNYVQGSNGALDIEVNPGTMAGTGYDQLLVSGSAQLAGTLAIQVDNGNYSVGSLYDVLHASGGISGNFGTVSYSPAFAAYLTPQVNYSANDVTLELTPTMSTSNLSDAAAFAGGRVYVASNFAQDSALLNVIASPFDGMSDTAGGSNQGYWLHGIGSFGHANGYDINEKGFVIGKGFVISPKLTLGGAVSNVYTSTTDSSSSVNGNSFGALIYGIYTTGPINVSASAGVGHLGTDIHRGLSTLGETATASSNGTYEAAALRLQYDVLRRSSTFITPYAAASYLHSELGSAVETGAGILDLRYNAMSTSLAELGAGVTAGINMPTKYGIVTPWVQFGGTGTLGNPHVRNTEELGTFSAGETALGAPVGAFAPAAGIELAGNGAWHLAATWGGQFGSAASVENFNLDGRYTW